MGNVTVDFKELKRFAEQLNSLNQEKINEFNEAAVKRLAGELLRNVKMNTPIGQYPSGSGKVGGTLQSGWTVGEVVRDGDTFIIEVFNPVEYASYVEFGHRIMGGEGRTETVGFKEGRFMMTVAADELRVNAPQILEEKLLKFMESIFDE